MTEIDSRNIEFLKDEFPNIGEIKKDRALYELQQDDLISLGEGKNITLTMPPRIVLFLCFKKMMRLWLPKRINLRMRFILSL